MKITDVTVHKMNPGVGKNFVFVKIQTDAGITGWGRHTRRRTATSRSRPISTSLDDTSMAATRFTSGTSPT